MAELTISIHTANSATILYLSGDIVFGEGTTTLRRTLRHLIKEGQKEIYLNLQGVLYLDSSGIGELISALTAVNREGGHLRLLNPPQRVQKLLEISKLLTVFDIAYEAESRAVSV